MDRDAKVLIVEAYLNGLGNRSFDEVPFATDVTYESPLTEKLSGREAIEFLEALFPIIKGVTIKKHIVEGDTIATIFDLHVENGTAQVFDCFRVEDGLLKEIHPFYDPGPLQSSE